jgi:hypothetical protein
MRSATSAWVTSSRRRFSASRKALLGAQLVHPGCDLGFVGGLRKEPAEELLPGVSVESAAHQSRADPPGQHRAGPPAGPALGPPGRLDHLRPPLAPGAGQRGRLHRGPGHPRGTRHRHSCWPQVFAGQVAAVRDPRQAAGVLLGEQPACLPAAATATPARLLRIRPGRRTPTYARTGSCRICPLFTSSSPARSLVPGG